MVQLQHSGLKDYLKVLKKGGLAIPNNYGIANPCYIQNFVEAVFLATTKDEAVGRVFNVTDDEEVTWKDFLMPHMKALEKERLPTLPYSTLYCAGLLMELIAMFTGKQPFITRTVVKFMTFQGKVSADKLKSTLGYKPPLTFKEAMSLTTKYVRERYG